MKKTFFFLFILYIGTLQAGYGQRVYMSYDRAVPQATYGAGMLKKALIEKNFSITDNRKESVYSLTIQIDTANLVSEAFSIIREGKSITITGGDKRGMIYGCLALAEDIANGVRLQNMERKVEKPYYLLRAIRLCEN